MMSDDNKGFIVSFEPSEEADELRLDWYYEDLIDYVRKKTKKQANIKNLLDPDLRYFFELLDGYADELGSEAEDEDEEVEIDLEQFYNYVMEAAEEDQQDINITIDDLVLLVELQREYDEVELGDDDDDDDNDD